MQNLYANIYVCVTYMVYGVGGPRIQGRRGWLRILSELRALAAPLRFTAVHSRLRVAPDGATLLKKGQVRSTKLTVAFSQSSDILMTYRAVGQGADYHTGYCGAAH